MRNPSGKSIDNKISEVGRHIIGLSILYLTRNKFKFDF